MNIDLTDHDSLVQRPISANPRINLNPGFIITLFKSLFFLDNHPHSFKSIILSNCKQKQLKSIFFESFQIRNKIAN